MIQWFSFQYWTGTCFDVSDYKRHIYHGPLLTVWRSLLREYTNTKGLVPVKIWSTFLHISLLSTMLFSCNFSDAKAWMYNHAKVAQLTKICEQNRLLKEKLSMSIQRMPSRQKVPTTNKNFIDSYNDHFTTILGFHLTSQGPCFFFFFGWKTSQLITWVIKMVKYIKFSFTPCSK